MNIKIEKSIARGEINAPPSKSYAHRLLIASSLARGQNTVLGVSDSVDMQATLECLSALGIEYSKKADRVSINGGASYKESAIFNCHESGSTLRFFIPIALVICKEATFIGTQRLMSRGIEIYEEIFKKQNIEYEKTETTLKIKGSLKADTFFVRGDISSQFITGLLFALPLLEKDSVIKLTTPLQSSKYVDVTIDVLKQFGIEIEQRKNEIYVSGNQKYKPQNVIVEADASNSAFLEAFNVLGGDVSIKGLNENTLQPDGIYKKLFLELKNKTPTIDLSSCPDLGPITFALSACLNGAKFIGTKRLKIKESDRCEAMKAELEKFGVRVEIGENSAIVYGGTFKKPDRTLDGHNDHRIVMALSVISTLCGAEIAGCEAVNKSYPNFFDDISKLGIALKKSEV
ncbi:MAG: 3-phosphoshikimate 1-carboxyvinyltransferase [Clostridia bacterium]|nr:3-phosphoshikimate 1-carboxyvinyltransferase [Clostridia bacterium]